MLDGWHWLSSLILLYSSNLKKCKTLSIQAKNYQLLSQSYVQNTVLHYIFFYQKKYNLKSIAATGNCQKKKISFAEQLVIYHWALDVSNKKAALFTLRNKLQQNFYKTFQIFLKTFKN